MKLKLFVTFALAFLVLTIGAVPQLMNYQGILKDNSGDVVQDGSYAISFAIYGTESGGNAIWTETQNVTTVNGVFQVILGSVNNLVNFPATNAWLAIRIGSEAEMLPRKRIASVGYAFSSEVAQIAQHSVTSTTADNANNLQGLTANDFVHSADYTGTFSALAPPITFQINQADVWYDLRTLTVTVVSQMNLRCHGFLRRGTAGGPFSAQILLKNQQGQVIDYGTRSWRNPANVNAILDTEITYTVAPGTYTVSLTASFSGPGTIDDTYIELLAFPQSTRGNYVSETPPQPQILRPYTNGPLTQP